LGWRVAWLEDENAALREEQQRLEAERERLRGENERLRAERERLQELNERLRGEVEALRRAAKRQAAPFSKGDPTPNPKRSGRRPGAAYGTRVHRRPPEHVDQVVTVGLPACCPGCGGELALERVATQHVEELPPTLPLVTRFEVQVGRCRVCGRRVQPRHPAQGSDALGAAGAQLGPRAVALAAWLSKGLGVPADKIARLFAQLGLRITPGGVTQAVARAARRCQPTYQALAEGVPASPVVAPDETGWRVGGCKAWLWAFVGAQVTLYRIAHGRGYADAVAVLGEGYAGVLERDGWAPIAASGTRPTRPAWRTCCGAAGNSSATRSLGRPRPRTRCAASWSTRWRCGRPTTPAPWMRPRWSPRPSASAHRSTSWWAGRPATRPTAGC
jgi:FtsZ-binding cell division protein ZapB